MRRFFSPRIVGATLLAAAAFGAAGTAHARTDVFVSIGAQAPGAYGAPYPGYAHREPVYTTPAPVYVQPRPIFVQPRPVYAPPQVVYERPWQPPFEWSRERERERWHHGWERRQHERRHGFGGRDWD